MKVTAINRRIILPQIIGTGLSVMLTGSVTCLMLWWLDETFQPLYALPVLLLLADEAFVVSRTSLLIHHHARHTHAGVQEFLTGNGARRAEAMMPYLKHMLLRTFKLTAWRWCLTAVMALLVFFFVVIIGHVSPVSAVLLLLGLALMLVVGSLLAVAVAVFIYEKLKI